MCVTICMYVHVCMHVHVMCADSGPKTSSGKWDICKQEEATCTKCMEGQRGASASRLDEKWKASKVPQRQGLMKSAWLQMLASDLYTCAMTHILVCKFTFYFKNKKCIILGLVFLSYSGYPPVKWKSQPALKKLEVEKYMVLWPHHSSLQPIQDQMTCQPTTKA